MPHVNEYGSTPKETAAAVKHLEEAGDPERLLSWVARNRIWRNGGVIWLGIEMVVNEENERHALESELALLEEAWKDAEEVASIADRLMMPRDVDEKLAKLKKSV